jgi:tyrosyl-tRNA synthetase
MMWRYYELLTDVQFSGIEALKRELHPMDAKRRLAHYIVKDFHSPADADKAGEDWVRQFQKHGVPEELECVDVPFAAVMVEGVRQVMGGHSIQTNQRFIRLQKLIPLAGLAVSNTEATAKCKQGAVELFDLQGRPFAAHDLVVVVPVNEYFVLRVGRRMKKVRVIDSTDGQRTP